jgi:two-component system sensor histidine kinase NreB
MLNVHDDGVGFDLTQQPLSGHYGVPGMEDRARLMGGKLKVMTKLGQGTMITLDLPLRTRAIEE